MAEDRSLLRDIVKGALAGAAATWVMGLVTTYMYEHEGEQARHREDETRGGRTAFASAADKLADLGDVEASEPQLETAGSALHWGLGIGAGVAYAVLRGRWLDADWKGGLQFGSGFFLVVDEIANPMLGLTPGPRAFPWQAHARGFAGHAVFGATAEGAMRVLDRIG